ncbi:hypothetical protein CVT26_008330 [Gymnopilus dilepis]|uniref:Uncharacterized protein n=1 Tax=Gymnopilus dilepis TaxID=231916 RepID=A0A409XY75_9AGAR|nr:hypothetical protein CVT26_008330 [Gymnopilus dilepis]
MSSRAGLFLLFVFLAFFGFSTSAPIPSRSSRHVINLVERYDSNDNELLTRSFDDTLVDRELYTADPVVNSKRDYLFALIESRDTFGDVAERDLEDILNSEERDFEDDSEYDFAKRESEILERRGLGAKIRHAFKSAFHKVGHFFKTTGAKIAKFGLKIAAAGASIISKAARFIPGIGTGISTALKGIATGVNAASNKIHANLGKKLGKVANGLNYVINPLKAAGKKLGKKGKVVKKEMLRAGLFSVFLIFVSFIGSISCAPLPERASLSVVKRQEDLSDFLARELDFADSSVYVKRDYSSVLDDREFDDLSSLLYERDLDELVDELYERDDLYSAPLYRRKSIFTKIKHAFQHAAHAVGHAFHAVGHAVVHAAKAVGHFVKTTGKKIAKLGLKIYAAGAAIAAKVVRFIPGIGTGVATALKGVSAGANAASNKIHANLGKFGNKLDHGLNYVINPMGSATKHMGKGGKALSALLG